MLARDVMSSDVVTVGANATILEAIKLLINEGVSGLPVVDASGAIVGMLSEFDVIRHVAGTDSEAFSRFQSQLIDRGALGTAYTQALSKSVKTIMTKPALTAPDDADLKAVADLMLQYKMKRIPIVKGPSVVGVISRVDLLKALLSRPGDDAGVKAAARPSQKVPVDDDQLRQAVIKAVRQSGVPVSGGFDVVSHNGVAHLWGVVANEASHEACQVTALRVPGVSDIVSHMQIVPMRYRSLYPRWQ